MLYLHQSNRLENLAHTFTAFQKNQPLSNPFAKEQIVVQSRGMGRYLHVFLAQEIGIAANLRLTLPASFSWQLMVSVLPGLQPNSPFATEAMAWRLFAYFQAHLHPSAPSIDPVFEPLRHYLALGEEAAFDLANKLADIFDQYLVYRPHWIQTWEAGRLNDLGEHEPWQARLWQYLSEHPAPHRVRMWDQLLAALPQAQADGRLPERINIFGIATLAPMYIELFNQLAQYIDVHLFALNPSAEHWGHVIEPAMILQLPPEQQSLLETGHPLLASLGKQGRDFFDALAVDMTVGHDIDVFEETPDGTLLQQLQGDLLHLRLPDASHQARLHDGSIQIHSAHSPLRELQILKNQLLARLEADPSLSYQDIAVLTPNIDAYAPFIDALFGQHDDQPYLPFTLTDTKILSSHPFLFAFAALLELLDGRFELDQVLALLDAEPLRRRFDLTERDIDVIRQHITQMNIHWGLDETMRRQYGGQDDAFTWAQGLERLILGFMLPSHHSNGSPLLWANKAPSGLSHQHMTVLAQFSTLLRTLGSIHQAWQQPASMDDWWQRIQDSIQALFLFADDDQTADGHLQQSLQKLIESIHLAQSHGLTVGFPIVKAHILRYLDSKNDASFLRGGITFCSMVPMRSLPFKVLCLIGLNDGEFPRDEKADSFDLIAAHPKKGDRSRRNDDQYLFLEALMSAREVLYLSYVGRSIKNNDPLPPSTLVSELVDTVANMTGALPQDLHDHWVIAHPLQPFSKSYFNAHNPRLISYDEGLAAALNQPVTEPQPFLNALSTEQDASPQLALNDLLSFWRNPVRAWLNQTLGLYPTYWGKDQTPHEPFSLDSGQQARVHQAFLQAKLAHHDYADTSAYLQAIDALPVGELGVLINEAAQHSIKKLALPDAILSPKLPHTPIQIRVNDTLISGYLGELHQAGQVFLAAQSMNAPMRINQLLLHLVLNAVRPTGPAAYETHVFYMDKDGNSVSQTYAELPQPQAHNLLEQWLAYYHAGLARPLPFFARTSLSCAEAYWETLQKTDSEPQAQERAVKTAYQRFIGNHHSPGQQQDQEVAMVFAGHDPIDDPEFMRLVTDLLVPVLTLGQHE